MKKMKRFKTTLVLLGTIGLLEILSTSLMDMEGLGIFSLLIAMPAEFIFGTKIAMIIAFVANLLLSLSLVYYFFAYLVHRRIVAEETTEGKPKPKASKSFKVTLMVLLIPFGILLLLGIIANFIS